MIGRDFPVDVIVRDLGQYNSPPFVPNLNLPLTYSNLLPEIVTYTINQIIINNRKNNIRVYCFNRLSDNNFQNQDFVELIQFIMSLIILNVESYRMDINQAVSEGVDKGCEYYASRMAFENRNLHPYIDANAERAITESLREMQEKQNIIDRFLNGQPISQPNNSSRFSNTFSSTFSNNNNFHNRSSSFQSNNFQNSGNSRGNVGYINPINTFKTNKVNEDSGRFGSRSNQKPINLNRQPITIVADKTQQDTGNNMKKNKILEGSDMSGDNFFGSHLDISSVIKKHELTLNNLTEIENEEKILSFITGTSLEDVLLAAKIKHIEIKNNNIKTFRSYCMVYEPIINNSLISKDVAPILGYNENDIITNLPMIAAKLKSLLLKVSGDIDSDKNYIVDLIKTISHIDNILTDLINEFMYESLDGILTIDSFIEDMGGLQEIMSIKSREVTKAWNLFCNNLVSSLTNKLNTEGYENIIDNIYLDDEKKDTILLTKIITATSLNMNYIQFGCKVDKDSSVIVDSKVTPNVFETIDGIFSMKETEINSVEDYLILNDGVHIKIYKDFINNQYKLKRIK